jgi:hypothetical protein
MNMKIKSFIAAAAILTFATSAFSAPGDDSSPPSLSIPPGAVVQVSEPSTLALMALSIAGLIVVRRKKN